MESRIVKFQKLSKIWGVNIYFIAYMGLSLILTEDRCVHVLWQLW